MAFVICVFVALMWVVYALFHYVLAPFANLLIDWYCTHR